MKKTMFLLFSILISTIFTASPKPTNTPLPDTSSFPTSYELRASSIISNSPLFFITNQGQTDGRAKFYAKTPNYTLWLTEKGLTFDGIKLRGEGLGDRGQGKAKRDVSRFLFVDANPHPDIIPLNITRHRVNILKGNDPSKWLKNIPTSKAVRYKNVYDSIDLDIYGMEKQIEYDWRVNPGGNPNEIKFQYKNVKNTRIDRDGNLRIETAFGELAHQRPVSYQRAGNGGQKRTAERIVVDVRFKKIGENTYGFDVGAYDKNLPLIIDPVVLTYSTYLGGGEDDEGYGVAVDNDSRHVYITGYTRSTDFPVQGEYDTDYNGDFDGFVVRVDATRSGFPQLLYSTYLGGSGGDVCRGIAVDDNGYAYVVGTTDSDDFPTKYHYQKHQTGYGTNDIFITKLDTARGGDAGLLYSTYLGGTWTDYSADIAVDSNGNAYVTGFTISSDFPLKDQYQAYPGAGLGLDKMFVSKIDTTQKGNASLVYSTYLGGSGVDRGSGIAVDGNGIIYVSGYGWSDDFPTVNPYQTDPGDDETDVYLSKLDPSQPGEAGLLYSTYLGGGGSDYGRNITVDADGCVYLCGVTGSTDFPTLNPFQTDQNGAISDGFVAKLDTTRTGGAALLYSTYLGGRYGDGCSDVAVDAAGYVYVCGTTYSGDFPTLNPYQEFPGGSPNAFVAKLDVGRTGGASLLYSSYLGGNRGDTCTGIALDKYGAVYLCGATYSTDFPTIDSHQLYGGNGDAFLSKFFIYTSTPIIELNRTQLTFGAVKGGVTGGAQTFAVSNAGEDVLNWTAAADEDWIHITPSSGMDSGLVTVTVDAAGKPAGIHTGTITVSDPAAFNSSEAVSVTLNIYTPGGSGPDGSSAPFGLFSTPEQGAVVSSSIPVTGWVLDDVGVGSVKIYRDGGVYIGDAVLVEGARPDVEQAYPDYPYNYTAGWGYMLLTNYLPNGGNGTFTLTATAVDVEGNSTTLGVKTITCDNADAVKPFGAIDTPGPGETISGGAYLNFGWALTPTPNEIPRNGSTIFVYIDGVASPVNPTYNQYREDIADLFPGYANSDGAVGYFTINTPAYDDGVHTISWTVTDDAGNSDGIGSRYFSIRNAGSMEHGARSMEAKQTTPSFSSHPSYRAKPARIHRVRPRDLHADIDHSPVFVKKGFNPDAEPVEHHHGADGIITVELEELQRLELHLSLKNASPNGFHGYAMVGGRLRALPIGSTLDTARGVFYWHPGPGFLGEYFFTFAVTARDGAVKRKDLRVVIRPR